MTESEKSAINGRVQEQTEADIRLIDYLLVMWKWKFFIIAVTVLCGATAGVLNLYMFKADNRFRIEALFEPAVHSIDDNFNKLYIDPPQKIKDLIVSGFFEGRILEQMKDTSYMERNLSSRLEFLVLPVENTLKVSYETENRERGIEVVNALLGALENYNQEAISFFQDNYTDSIELVKAEQEQLKKEANVIGTKFENIDKRIQEISLEIRDLDAKSVDFGQKAASMSKKGENDFPLSFLLCNNLGQQTIGLIADLKAKRFEYLIQKEDSRINLIEIENKLRQKDVELKKMEEQRKDLGVLKIVQKPAAFPSSQKKPSTLLHVVLASLAGFFLAVFLAFFLEYIVKARKEYAPRSISS